MFYASYFENDIQDLHFNHGVLSSFEKYASNHITYRMVTPIGANGKLLKLNFPIETSAQ